MQPGWEVRSSPARPPQEPWENPCTMISCTEPRLTTPESRPIASIPSINPHLSSRLNYWYIMGLRNWISIAKMSLGIVKQYTLLNWLYIQTHILNFRLTTFLWHRWLVHLLQSMYHRLYPGFNFFLNIHIPKLETYKWITTNRQRHPRPCDNSSVSLKFFWHRSIHEAQFGNQFWLILKYLLSSFLSPYFYSFYPNCPPFASWHMHCFKQIPHVYINCNLYTHSIFSHFCSFNLLPSPSTHFHLFNSSHDSRSVFWNLTSSATINLSSTSCRLHPFQHLRLTLYWALCQSGYSVAVLAIFRI